MKRALPLILASAFLLAAKPAKQPKAEKAEKAPAAAPVEPLSYGQAKVSETTVDLNVVDEPRKVAEAYLRALEGKGDEAARETLLGGATLNARLEVLSNWRIVAREPLKSEQGELADVQKSVESLDKEGRAALAKLMGGGPGGDGDPEGLGVEMFDAETAAQIQGPTKARAAAFYKSHPVFAYVIRVDREVYWHPKNPMRKLLGDVGSTGRYQLDFNLFRIETLEGRDKKSRVWPLRVVRMRTDKMDTGWKVLPASDWNAE
ncbi:MAG: hypothetical protein AB2A00_30880 [Myxococcota bacterium]